MVGHFLDRSRFLTSFKFWKNLEVNWGRQILSIYEIFPLKSRFSLESLGLLFTVLSETLLLLLNVRNVEGLSLVMTTGSHAVLSTNSFIPLAPLDSYVIIEALERSLKPLKGPVPFSCETTPSMAYFTNAKLLGPGLDRGPFCKTIC